MNRGKIDHFRNKLEEEKTDLEKRLGEFAVPPVALGGEWQSKFPNRQEGAGHDANEESANESEEYGANIALTQNLARQLEDVNLALKKIENANMEGAKIAPAISRLNGWKFSRQRACVLAGIRHS